MGALFLKMTQPVTMQTTRHAGQPERSLQGSRGASNRIFWLKMGAPSLKGSTRSSAGRTASSTRDTQGGCVAGT